MSSRLKTLPIVLALVVLLLVAATASAQTYTVTRTDDPNPAPCEPGDCSLRGALMASNASETVNDVVVLPASGAPYLLQYEFIPFTISDETEVRGAGANQAVVKGDGMESIFAVGVGTKATLTGLTITGGTSAIQSQSELILRGVSIEGNKWNGGTAGIITNGPLTVESSFLGFNRTESVTAGVIFSNAPVTIVNSTIAHNSSKEGLGAIGGNAGVTIVNSAIVSNRSETAPAAAVGGSPLTVRNSVFADNRDATGLLSCASTGPLTSFGGNASDDATCGTGASDRPNVNPLLGTLALHGGTTQVYDLLAGSPAIDFASGCPPLDQRGVSRPQGAACDSGPYEFVPRPPQQSGPVLDTGVAILLAKGKLFLSAKRFARIKLTCPATEASPPCSGSVKLKTRKKVEFRSKRKQLLLGRTTFTIPAGKTASVSLRLSPKKAELVRSDPKARKVFVIVRARDATGNRQLIEGRRKLVPR
jgi:hypothetical protein